jgi:hypothetical protein
MIMICVPFTLEFEKPFSCCARNPEPGGDLPGSQDRNG